MQNYDIKNRDFNVVECELFIVSVLLHIYQVDIEIQN